MKHINKIVLSLALFFAITLQGLAQAPQAISYQAAVRDADGKILANQAVSIKISILQNATDGNAVYVETHALTTNAHGLVNLAIGRGTPITGTFAAIDWSAAKYYSKMEMDASGGTTYKEVGTSEILSVPYALVAKTVEKAKVPIMTLAELSDYKNGEVGEIIFLTIPAEDEDGSNFEQGIYVYDGRQWSGPTGGNICLPLPTNYSAGEDQFITSGATSTTLNASVTNGTGKWFVYNGADGGSFDDPTKPNAVFTGLLNVEYRLRWTVYDLCGNGYDSYYDGNEVTIKFFPAATLSYTQLTEYTYDSNGNQTTYIESEYYKKESTFDANNLETSYIDYYWDWENSNWKINNKAEIAYNANKKISSINYYTWDGANWLISSKGDYTYDAKNNNSSVNSYTWDGTSWINSSKTEQTFDANSNLTNSTTYTWDGTNWINSSKLEQTFDVNSNLTSKAGYKWNGSSWAGNFYKNEYSYDEFNREVSHIIYKWLSDSWANYIKSDNYIYDDKNRLISHSSSSWDGTNWVISLKTESSYDANSRTLIGYSFNGSEWVNSSKYEQIFNANGQEISLTRLAWKTDHWALDYKFIYTYDANGKLLSEKFEDYTGGKKSSENKVDETNENLPEELFKIDELMHE